MRIRRIIVAVLILGIAQGCTAVRTELRHSGGFAGHIMDQRFFVANTSKRLQLLRLTMVIALASRVGTAAIRDAREAEAFVSYLQNASEEANYLAGHLYGQRTGDVVRNTCSDLDGPEPAQAAVRQAAPGLSGSKQGEAAPAEADTAQAAEADTAQTAETAGTTPVAPAAPTPAAAQPGPSAFTCDTYEALFESDLPQLEYKVVRLVLSALPQRQAADFLRSARSGNILGAAWQFLRLAAAAADGFHRGAATYRSSQEIVAIAILSATNDAEGRDAIHCADRPAAPDQSRIRTVEDAAACLGLSPNDIFDNPREAAVRFPRDFGEQPFQALYEIIRTSCGLLPIEVGLNSDTEPAKIRRQKCATLVFEPQLRFGGRTGWAANRQQSSSSVATTTTETAREEDRTAVEGDRAVEP